MNNEILNVSIRYIADIQQAVFAYLNQHVLKDQIYIQVEVNSKALLTTYLVTQSSLWSLVERRVVGTITLLLRVNMFDLVRIWHALTLNTTEIILKSGCTRPDCTGVKYNNIYRKKTTTINLTKICELKFPHFTYEQILRF